MNRQQFTTYLSETLIPDLREADMHATAEDFETALRFMAEDAERIASLEAALAAAESELERMEAATGHPCEESVIMGIRNALKP